MANEQDKVNRSPEASRANRAKESGGKKRIGLIILLVAIILALAVAAVVLFLRNRGDGYNDEDFYDPMAVTGILPNMTEAQIQEELNRVVEEGMLNVSIAGEIMFRDGTSQGRANIINSEANHYDTKVIITLDETGETVYASKGIKPGQYIQYITLTEDLDAGEYPATATVTAYTTDTRQIVGRVSVKLDLIVST